MEIGAGGKPVKKCFSASCSILEKRPQTMPKRCPKNCHPPSVPVDHPFLPCQMYGERRREVEITVMATRQGVDGVIDEAHGEGVM